MVVEVMIPMLEQTGGDITLTTWLKREGDQVRAGEPICEVETAKATVEIEASGSGVLRKQLIAAGTPVPALTVVALIAEAGEPLPEVDPFYRLKPVEPAPSPAAGTAAPTAEAAAPRPARALMASPRAKRLAAEHAIDLSLIRGTGPKGDIVESDVRRAIEQTVSTNAQRVAQARAQRVAQSWQTIPHFYTSVTIDLSRVAERKSHDHEQITYTDYFAHAIAEAIRHVPAVNGHWSDDGPRSIAEVHLGLVVQTERGLVIPTLRDVQRRSLLEIAAERRQLIEGIHAGKLSGEALSGASFTLSNIGPGEIDQFTAIISPPQLAILSVGSVLPRPIVVDSNLVVRSTATFTLGADHRAIDGRQAAAFLQQLKAILEVARYSHPI
jgi:pyruvate dehydrogenase E2 component (dihydrolipoamide acetyltransferase)